MFSARDLVTWWGGGKEEQRKEKIEKRRDIFMLRSASVNDRPGSLDAAAQLGGEGRGKKKKRML